MRRNRHRQRDGCASGPYFKPRVTINLLSLSTAPRCPNPCSRVNYSVTRKGQFTGAVGQRPGRFELAEGGTLFLDEIGETGLSIQAKLLRVLQEREFVRVGGTQTITSNARIIAATNRDLKAEIEAGRFREDLYYRLNVFPIRTPPLRERIEDIPLLVRHFIQQVAPEMGIKPPTICDEALACMMRYRLAGQHP